MWRTAVLGLAVVAAGCPAAPAPRGPAGGDPAATELARLRGEVSRLQQLLAAPPPPSLDKPDAGMVVLEGTPEIPADLRQRLNQYLNVRAAGLEDIRRDGAAVLVRTRFGQTAQAHLVSRPLGVRRQLTFGDEPVGAARFVPGARAVVYTVDVGGNEQHQILRLDLDTGRTTLLTDGTSRNGTPLLSRDGKRMAFASTRRNGVDFDIWVSDAATAESAQLAAEGKGWWNPLDWSRDGNTLLVVEYISANESRVHRVDIGSRKVEQITPAEPVASHAAALLSADGKRAYITSDREGEFAALYEVDLARGTWTSLTRGIAWNVEEIALSADGRSLAFTTNEGGPSALHILDTRSRKHTRARGVPLGVISSLQFAERSAAVGFSVDSSRGADAYSWDVKRRKLVRWTESELGGLDASRFVEPTIIEYTSFDGKKIPALYSRPAGDGPFPVVIDIHGGPEAQVRPDLTPFVQYLVVEERIAVVAPNVRGSDGYGKSYLLLDNAGKREDSVKDIGALLDWIAGRSELDAKRVAVQGGSYGGYMVLASLVHFPKRIVAGIDLVGISSFVTFLENTAEYRRDLRRAEYGDERDPKMRKLLEAISPLHHVGKIDSALFVAQGANDPRVPASEAEQIVRAVKSAGHDVWYMLAKNEGHGFARRENRDTFLLLATMFLRKHLGGG